MAEGAANLQKGADVDDSAGAKVAEQLWTFVRPRLDLILRPDGVATKTHEWLKLPTAPAFRKVDTSSLSAFADSIEELLGPAAVAAAAAAPADAPCDENVDDQNEGVLTTAAAQALSLASIAQQIPIAIEGEELYEIQPAPEDMEDLFAKAEAECSGQAVLHARRSGVAQAFNSFLRPKSVSDLVEAAVKLCTSAMHSKTVSCSLPDTSHSSIEQRWMTIDRALGPTVHKPDADACVGRHDMVQFKGQFWRIIGAFAKYYGRWSCVGESVPLTSSHRFLLQALRVNKNHHPYVQDNFSFDPFLVVASADECKDLGYSLIREEEYQYKQQKRKIESIWL